MSITSASLMAFMRANEAGSSDFGGPVFSPAVEQTLSITNGTGASQADQLFVDERTVSSASNDDLDLAGVLASAFGSTLTMAKLVGLIIINAPKSTTTANTTNLTIGGATNPFVGFLGGTTPTIGPIRPGGFVFLGCNDAGGIGTVTAGTADILRVANSAGASATYQIGIIARSA